MASVITLAGLGWQSTDIMNTMYGGFAHTGGNTHHPINYTPQFDGVFSNGVGLLNTAINSLPTPQIVIGHSLGAEIASVWLENYGVSQADKAATTRFVLSGNPMRRYGGRANIPTWPVNGVVNRHTPDDTAFQVDDVARQDDGWCNWPASSNPFNPNGYDFFKVGAALANMFFGAHLLYLSNINLDDLYGTHLSVSVLGNTTYHLMA